MMAAADDAAFVMNARRVGAFSPTFMEREKAPTLQQSEAPTAAETIENTFIFESNASFALGKGCNNEQRVPLRCLLIIVKVLG